MPNPEEIAQELERVAASVLDGDFVDCKYTVEIGHIYNKITVKGYDAVTGTPLETWFYVSYLGRFCIGGDEYTQYKIRNQCFNFLTMVKDK